MQDGATRTRSALIRAAASEFDRLGYEGASLSRISELAYVSMGTLTFHFATKQVLADTVRAAGRSAVDPVVRRAACGDDPPLESLAVLISDLVRLLEHDVVVRAATRLERERPGGGDADEPAGDWARALRLLLDQAQRAGELRSGVLPGTAAVLITRLVEGSRMEISRSRAALPKPAGGSGSGSTRDAAEGPGAAAQDGDLDPGADGALDGGGSAWSQAIWHLVLHGVRAAPLAPRGVRPDGADTAASGRTAPG